MHDKKGIAHWTLRLLAVVLLAMVFSDTIRWLIKNWFANSYYSHGLLVPFISGLLAYRLWPRKAGPENSPLSLSMGAICLAASLGLALLIRGNHWVSSIALITAIASLAILLFGTATALALWFPLAMLLLMVPLPFVPSLAGPLARQAALATASITSSFGVAAVSDGARIELAGAALEVGAPCSGLNSLAALTTLGALVAFCIEGEWLPRLLLFLLSAPIALASNIVRLVLLALVADRFGSEAALGYYHDWSGMVLFGFALLLLLTLSRVLGCHGLRRDL